MIILWQSVAQTRVKPIFRIGNMVMNDECLFRSSIIKREYYKLSNKKLIAHWHLNNFILIDGYNFVSVDSHLCAFYRFLKCKWRKLGKIPSDFHTHADENFIYYRSGGIYFKQNILINLSISRSHVSPINCFPFQNWINTSKNNQSVCKLTK